MSEIEPKLPGSYQSELVKSAVIAKYLLGESKSKIARELGISRPTVRNIILKSDIANLDFVAEVKEAAKELSPEALEVVTGHLRNKSLKAALAILSGTGVFSDRVEVAKAPEVSWNQLAAPVYEASKEKPN